MKTLKKALAGAVGATVAFAATTASAACPTHQVIFLFDQSGSMSEVGASGAVKQDISLSLAQADWAAVPSTAQVGIYGFGNTTTGGNPYLYEIVPLSQSLVKSANASYLSGKLTEASRYNYSYMTPLAAAACDALELVFLADPICGMETKRTVYLYTDGLENASPTAHQCYSATSSVGLFNDSLAGQGFGLDAGSWERKIANMAWTGNPTLDDLPGLEDWMRPTVNVRALFNRVNALGSESERTPSNMSANVQSITNGGADLFAGLAKITYGNYIESKTVNGVATKIPVVGDTDPTPTRSCVEAADRTRVLEAYGRTVKSGDPKFSAEDLAKRDVNDDRVINTLDYYLVIQNYGKCAQ